MANFIEREYNKAAEQGRPRSAALLNVFVGQGLDPAVLPVPTA